MAPSSPARSALSVYGSPAPAVTGFPAPRAVPRLAGMPAPAPRASRPPVRLAIRVKPGAARARVGGSYGDAGALVVAVTERAVDGKATAAALAALARELGLPRGAVTLLTGAVSRDKVVEVADPPEDLADRIGALRG